MGTARFYSGTDRSIGTGTWTYTFNPLGDPIGATTTEVRFRFFIDYKNGSKVDLGDVDIWLRAPDGDQDTIYYNFDGFGADGDDGNDSDPNSDYDISFWGTDFISKTPFALDNSQVNGNWQLIVKNDTGKTLDLDFLEVWVDYNAPEDYRVKDISILGKQDVDQPVIIQATIDNVGEKWVSERVDIEYLVEGKVIGTSVLSAGLLPGQNKVETELHSFDKVGANEVQVRIVGSPDLNTANNSRTETFTFNHNQADLAVTDISILGNLRAGSNQLITADIKNVGNATHTGPVELEYLVGGKVIGTQMIEFVGTNVMAAGTTNSESEFYLFEDVGSTDVTVRIANPASGDYSAANDSLTESFFFSPPSERPDLAVTDVRVIGGWHEGDTVNLRAHIENIGDDGWNLLLGAPQVEYFVRYDGQSNWSSVGSDSLSFGLPSGWSDWEDTSFTLAEEGAFEIKVELSGNDTEWSTVNNVWEEQSAHSRSDLARKTLKNSADEVELAMLMARTVYGGEDIPEDFRADYDNGLEDDYEGYLGTLGFDVLTDADFGDKFRPVDELSQFYKGGLFAGDQGIAFQNPDNWQAQGLVAVSDDFNGSKTMTLAFRGTDGKDLLESTLGQSFTGDGLFDYYESMRPLIDAALAYANDSANGIEKVVVSGHSLGGATTDAFALVDAHRLNKDIDLTVVSFASAGLNPRFLSDNYLLKGMHDQFNGFETFDPLLDPPSYYIGVSHAIDMVTFPEDNLNAVVNPLINPLWNKIPNSVLLPNLNMHDALTSIETPNMKNEDMPGFNFGSGHNSGFYWANVSQIMSDELMTHFDDHKIIIGLSDYSDVEDFDGSSYSVFEKYDFHGTAGNDNDRVEKALNGDGANDFILGFSGHDQLYGRDGNDLLSGGAGQDTIFGNSGNDRLAGGAGSDVLDGGSGNDVLKGGADTDTMTGGAGKDWIYGQDGLDKITASSGNDYVDGGSGTDRMDYSAYDNAITYYKKMDTVFKGSEVDTLVNIENVFGTAFNDRLIGDANNDYFVGGDGNDIIRGKDGKDTFLGGNGNDQMRGGSGVDNFKGEAGNDILASLGGKDYLNGGAGDDFLYGGQDEDWLVGGTGDDVLNGNRGNDTLRGGTGEDTLRGGGNNDTLQGEQDDDAIFGGGGADVLEGGAGNDKLWGGWGAGVTDGVEDVFVFNATSQGGGGFDEIKDFENGIDSVDLSAMGFDSFDQVSALASDRSTGLRLDFAEGDVLFLVGMTTSDLDASDVILG